MYMELEMVKIIEVELDNSNKVILDEKEKRKWRNLFSGCNINFLFGAGFSASVLGTLGNYETIMEQLRVYEYTLKEKENKVILTAYIYFMFFSECIYPIVQKIKEGKNKFLEYNTFVNLLLKILSNRENNSINKQTNIFTSNYDPILETILDKNHTILYNDGFEGRINPYFSIDNFCKAIYKQSTFSDKKSEIPVVNILKLHGSVTWENNDNNIGYVNYIEKLESFNLKYNKLFNKTNITVIQNYIRAGKNNFSELFTILKEEIEYVSRYRDFLYDYKNSFVIVNPTKEKFHTTLMNQIYYDLLRIYSNEMEKNNSLFICLGFSFEDEHILEITKRSIYNPATQIIIFAYSKEDEKKYIKKFKDISGNNITIVSSKSKKNITLNILNQLMSIVLGEV